MQVLLNSNSLVHKMLILTLCFSLVAGHKLDGAQFGSKSSYFTVANYDDSSLEVKKRSKSIDLL